MGDGGSLLLVCYWLGAELLFELRYLMLGLGQLALRIFLLLLQALILYYHVFGTVPDDRNMIRFAILGHN